MNQQDVKQKEASESLNLTNKIIISWLGRRDSNPRMPGPKPGALPLGHSPLRNERYHSSIYYTPPTEADGRNDNMPRQTLDAQQAPIWHKPHHRHAKVDHFR